MSLIESKSEFDRFDFFLGAFYFVFVLFLIRMVDMQILKHEYYLKLAEKNRTQVINQAAPRGRIISADGTVLASNKPSYSLIYFPDSKTSLQDIKKMALYASKYVGADKEIVFNMLLKAKNSQKPVKVASNLGSYAIMRISELKNFYPGFQMVSEAIREYPYGTWLSHITGYMGKIDAFEWKNYSSLPEYSMDSLVGKTGVEKIYEKYLKGKDGGLYVEVDNKGRMVKIADSREGEPGSDLYLTVNFNMQSAAEKALADLPYKRGAAIALDPYSGKILVYAVKPGFDPNFSVNYNEEKKEKDKNFDEFNIGVQGAYPPASVFKIITSIAVLENDNPPPDEKFFCPGFYDAGDRIFKCWEKKGHKNMDLISGLAHSCDVYYYNAALRVGPLEIEKTAYEFGFGQKTGAMFLSENSGNLFGPRVRARKKSYWFIGDTLNLAIGQGETLVTPMQMAVFAAALASKGLIYEPYYAEKILKRNGEEVFYNSPKLKNKIKLKEKTWEKIYEAMGEVIKTGTGRPIFTEGLEIYGKTGTAQNPHGKDHAWFICFAKKPGEKSKVAVASLIEHGEHGSTSALSVAKAIIRAAYPDTKSDSSKDFSSPVE
ncbi:MAG: penicillin-binding protein 2 [Elusimicrobia bacterium]|nr:penicillin-binding protein 2 [Elusimicrobiota bacterium]